MTKPSTPFIRLVFDDKPLSYAQRLAVYESVSMDIRQISALMRDEPVKDQLLIDFRTRAARLTEFFDTVKQSDTSVATKLWLELVMPIMTEWKVLDCDVLTEFLVSALRIAPTSILGVFAKMLADTPSVLERLVSDREGSKRLQDWSHTLNATVTDSTTLEMWTNRIISLCERCPIGHGVAGQAERWRELVALKAALIRVAERYGEEVRTPLPSDLPLLAGMRQLSECDKKSYRARRSHGLEQDTFNLPLNIANAVGAFGMAVPTSERALRISIESLEKEETLSILLDVIGTYPCRPCLDTANRLFEIAQPALGEQNLQSTNNLSPGLYEKRIGVWKVSLSAAALKDLRRLGLSGSDVFGLAEAKLRDLGSGCWRGLSKLAGSPHQRSQLKVNLLRAAVSRKLFILWQIEVGFDEVTSCVQQLIRVWKVDTDEEVSRAIDRVAILQKCYGEVSLQRCTLSPLRDAGGRYIPAKFLRDSGSVESADSGTQMDVRNTDKEVIEMSNKFYSLTEPVINSILSNDVEAEFPFDISEDEIKIIRHSDSASLILGRSGTGKTTCLVYKLLSKYLARNSVPGEKPLRQVLLTRSPFLSAKLRVYMKRLIETQTSKALLLDGSNQPEDILLEAGDDLAADSISTLRDELFPLVCTFDQFLRILENTVKVSDRKYFPPSGGLTQDTYSPGPLAQLTSIHHRKYMCNRKSQTVDFQTFKVDYWEQLPGTRHLPVELVFAEIMGIIKGSTSSRVSLSPLSREEYLSRGHRQAPLFTLQSERSRVYDLYEAYEGLKRQFGDADYIDRVVDLLKAIRADQGLRGRLGVAFDEVYVDEVQDQRSLDIELLLNIVRDARGFHLAGDTAQTISKDSTFRFADIKALFYHHFSSVGEMANQADLARPTQFVLSKNYRSHQGIISLASLVMKMLSTGFPDTIDKLEPEVGQLRGPRPTLFVGFGAQILSAQMVGLVKLHERIADFGAEQVILVRDEEAKKSLQAEIGDVALVLTILQSKGMEFDDVLLYNFFSESSCPSGLRYLGALAGITGGVFDPKKYMVLCSELKHLYVAVTRARIQLYIIESRNDRSVSEVIKVFTQDTSEPLVDVVYPDDPEASEKVKRLRSGKSIDPVRWSLNGQQLIRQRNFHDALFCFRKAGDEKGEKIATAYISQEEGRRCGAAGDCEGFEHNIQTAVDIFRQVRLIASATENLELLGRVEEAAELWSGEGRYDKAAPLFLKAGLFKEAANGFHLSDKHGDAAAALRQGNHFDELVEYLHWHADSDGCERNRQHLSDKDNRSLSRLCNLLLKQGRISTGLRARAVELLGSVEEQEKFFREFDMKERLADLYASTKRFQDLFYLQAEWGHLESALDVAVSHDLLRDIGQANLMDVLHYVRASYLFYGTNVSTIRVNEGLSSPDISRVEVDWDVVNDVLNNWGNIEARRRIADIQTILIKQVLCLHITINPDKYLDDTSQVGNATIEIVGEAVATIRELLVKDAGCPAWSSVCLLSGAYRLPSQTATHLFLPWSPLWGERKALSSNVNTTECLQLSKSWILSRVSPAVLAFNERLRGAWKRDWPRRCSLFSVRGRCIKSQWGGCTLLHKTFTPSDCQNMIKDLLRVCSLFGDLTMIHYRRVMGDRFHGGFLPARRFWLERFLEAITFLSSFEHDTTVVVEAQVDLFHNRKLRAIASNLEDLLFHRLGKEWNKRRNLSALLEQIQLAHNLGVDRRFLRALSYELSFNRDPYLVHAGRAISELMSVKREIDKRNAHQFNKHLDAALRCFEQADPRELVSFHAVALELEYLAAYLVLIVCRNDFLMPQSWLDMHLSLIADYTHRDNLSESERLIYQNSLLLLLTKSCSILRRIEQAFCQGTPDGRFSFTFGGSMYPYHALQRRSAELLAVVLVNLDNSRPHVRGFSDAWRNVREVFGFRFSEARHLIHQAIPILAENLFRSFSAYAGKNCLLVVTSRNNSGQTARNSLSFANLEKLGVRTIGLNEVINAQHRQREATLPNDLTPNTDAVTAAEDDSEKYSSRDIESASRIQGFWRHFSPRLKDLRSWKKAPLALSIDFFITLGQTAGSASLGTTTLRQQLEIRSVLVTSGVKLRLKLMEMETRIKDLRAGTIAMLENEMMPVEQMEAIDGVLEDLAMLDGNSERVRDDMAEGVLGRLVQMGVVGSVRKWLRDVEECVTNVEIGVERVSGIIGSLS